MSQPTLTQAVRLASGMTELCLVFSTWIISLPASPGNRPQDALSRQTLLAALYAISEPIYTLLLLRIALAPPILVIGTSIIHLTMSTSFTNSLNVVLAQLNQTSGSGRTVSYVGKSQPSLQSQKQSPSPERVDEIRAKYDRMCSAFEFAFTQTTAASNASLLLLGQYLLVANEYDLSAPMWLSAFGLVFFLISKMADYSLASVTQRPLFLGQRGLTADTWRQIQLLAVYLVVRTVVRLSLGMGPLGIFEKAAVIEQIFQPGHDAWWQDFVSKLPAWLPFALSAFSVVLTGLSHLYWTRVQRQAQETGQ
jgi:hypothetical protein